MPSSSRTAEDMPPACFCAKSLSRREERSATSCTTLEMSSGWLIAHHPVGAGGAARLAGVVKVVQVGDGLAHGEEGLVRVERAAEQHAEQLGGALRRLQRLQQLAEAVLVV